MHALALIAGLTLVNYAQAASPPNPIKVSKVDFLGPQRAQKPDGTFDTTLYRDGGAQGVLANHYYQIYADVCGVDTTNPNANCNRALLPNMIASQTFDPTIAQDFSDPPKIFCDQGDGSRLHLANMVPINSTASALWYIKLVACRSDQINQLNGCAGATGVAIATDWPGHQPNCTSLPGAWWDPASEPQWGATAAVLSPTDGKIYLFGSLDLNAPGGDAGDLYVARVSPSQANKIGSYEYWNGTTFTSRRLTYPNFNGYSPSSILQHVSIGSVFYSPYYKRWVALSAPNYNNLVAHTASAPQGPWSDPVQLWVNSTVTSNGALYLPAAVTSLDASGKTIITDLGQFGTNNINVVLKITFQ